MKKPEKVWFFNKQGGGEVPPNQTISGFFTELFYCFKMIYMLWNMKITNKLFSPIMTPSPLSRDVEIVPRRILSWQKDLDQVYREIKKILYLSRNQKNNFMEEIR